jgi:putative ABC transport system permease protein
MINPVLASSLRIGLDTLRINPLRTLLSTLGIIMGVAALVSVLSLGDGMERYARAQIQGTTDLQSVSVSPVLFRVVDGQTFARPDAPRFTHADVASLQRAVGADATVTLVVTGSALFTTRADTTPRATQLVGTIPNVVTIEGLTLSAGRFFSDAEVASAAPVVVLSRTLAADMARASKYTSDSPVGDTLIFQGSPYRIIGVIAERPGPATRVAIMPVTVANAAMPPAVVGRPTMLALKAPRIEAVTPAKAHAEGWLAERFGPRWRERATVATNQSRVAQVQQGMLLFKLFMGALTGISLLVGGIGIMNVLLASVIERTREIGIRKATGAQHRHILFQFLSESVTISGLGSVIGVVVGLGAAYSVTAFMRSKTQAMIYAGWSASTLAIGVLAAVIVGLTFGLYPALRAARLSPIEAIHHE